ncbi:MAG: serine/threonine protein phosphatase, partial [Clostridia bacterium]|nr:serine/threonine protein phosphatase [Clostridia bacterium]
GELFDFNGKKCLVIGGAYSVDKYYRLSRGLKWFEDEQPDEEIKNRVENRLAEIDFKTDIILSHTCPRKYEPIEAFLPGLDQSVIDKSTENWLDEIEKKTIYSKWYCGHWHISKRIYNFFFMFDDYHAI